MREVTLFQFRRQTVPGQGVSSTVSALEGQLSLPHACARHAHTPVLALTHSCKAHMSTRAHLLLCTLTLTPHTHTLIHTQHSSLPLVPVGVSPATYVAVYCLQSLPYTSALCTAVQQLMLLK